jgi:hypothetical protein
MNKGIDMTNLTLNEQRSTLIRMFPEVARITYEYGSWGVTNVIGEDEVTELYTYISGTKKFQRIGVISVEI